MHTCEDGYLIRVRCFELKNRKEKEKNRNRNRDSKQQQTPAPFLERKKERLSINQSIEVRKKNVIGDANETNKAKRNEYSEENRSKERSLTDGCGCG